jgi:phenylacetic acid degradation operon negative regulatory protein
MLLDLEPGAIRQAVRRASATGLLSPTRSGRRVAWSLTDDGVRLIREGLGKVFSFDGVASDWDGRWLFLSASVPETDKRLRDQLRRRLTWIGLGSPSPGLWITPHANRAGAVRAAIDQLRLTDRAVSCVGAFGAIGDERRMVSAAWDLDALADEYREFVRSFEKVRPRSGAEALRAHVMLAQSWRRFPFLDPQLPERFLPPRWPGVTARQLVARKRDEWSARSQPFWDELNEASQNGAT